MNESYTYRRIGTTGCEILCRGIVVAWAVDEAWAATIAQLLNQFPRCGCAGIEMPEVARCYGGPDNRRVINRNVENGNENRRGYRSRSTERVQREQ